MNESAGEGLSWNCPACNRRVPARFDDCRCGFHRQAAPVAQATAVEPSEPARSGLPPSPILILGAVIGIGIAVFMVRSRGEQPAASSAAPLTATIPSTDARIIPPVADASSADPIITSAPASLPASVPLARGEPDSIENIVSAALPAVASID